MKHGKKPTVEQSKFLAYWHLNRNDWLVVKDTPEFMQVRHRHFDEVTRILPKRKDDEV